MNSNIKKKLFFIFIYLFSRRGREPEVSADDTPLAPRGRRRGGAREVVDNSEVKNTFSGSSLGLFSK